VSRINFHRPFLSPLWAHLAVWLSFFAVLSALGAPAAALTLDVRNGKLGGVCNVQGSTSAAFNQASSPASGDAQDKAAHGHCQWCGSSGLALLPTVFPASSPTPVQHLAAVPAPSARALQVTGLPFSRGPPSL
jgi:hypothetical protein